MFKNWGENIAPGETKKIELEMPPLYTATNMSIPVYVKRGKKPGPIMFVAQPFTVTN